MTEKGFSPAREVWVTVRQEGDDDIPFRSITLSKEQPMVKIGRASKVSSKGFVAAPNNMWFETPVMSRNHAELSADFDKNPAAITIKDTGSLHGTYRLPVGGLPFQDFRVEPNKKVGLQDGDKLRFGIDIFRSHLTFPPCEVELSFTEKHGDFFDEVDKTKSQPVNCFVVPIDDDDEEDEEDEGEEAEEAEDDQAAPIAKVHRLGDVSPVDLTDDTICHTGVIDLTGEALTSNHEPLEMQQPSPTLEAQDGDMANNDIVVKGGCMSSDESLSPYSTDEPGFSDSDNESIDSQSHEGSASISRRSFPELEYDEMGSDDDLSDGGLQDTDEDGSDWDDEDQDPTTGVPPAREDEFPTEDLASPLDGSPVTPPSPKLCSTVATKDVEPATPSGIRISSLLEEKEKELAAENSPAVEQLGNKTGKHEYFIAREQNRNKVPYTNPKAYPTHAVVPESALRETLITKPAQETSTAPQEIALYPPSTIVKSAWASSGDDFINKPSPDMDDSVATEDRTRLQSPGYNMTSAHSFSLSKNNMKSTQPPQAQTVRRLDIQDLLIQKPIDTQDQDANKPTPVDFLISTLSKRSFDEAFDSEDQEQQPCDDNTEAPQEYQEVENLAVPVVVERNVRPTKKRRIAEVAACVALGGAGVLSALIMTAPTFS